MSLARLSTNGRDGVDPNQRSPWWERHPVAARRALLGAGFVAVTLLMRQVTWHSLTHTLTGAGDPDFNTWVMGWVSHSLFHPSHLFDANDFWPYHLTLTYSDDLIPLAPLFGVVRWVSTNEELAYNAVDLVLVLVSLAATYTLGVWLLGRRLVAVVAALTFTFSAYTQTHIVQVQLESVGLISLAFLSLFRCLEYQRIRDGIGFGLATTLATLTSPYYGAAWIVSAGVCTVGFLVWTRKLTSRLLASLVVAVLIAGAFIGPVALEYNRARVEQGLGRPLVAAYAFHLRDLLTPARGNWLYGTRLNHFTGVAAGENSLFPGLLTLVLAAVGAATLGRWWLDRIRSSHPSDADVNPATPPCPRQVYLVLLTLAGLASAILAEGGRIAGLPGPFLFLYHHVPGYDRVEVTARLAVILLLALAVLAANGTAWLVGHFSNRWATGMVALVCAVVLTEQTGLVNRHTVDNQPAAIAVYQALARLPEGPVVELPMVDPALGAEWNFVGGDQLRYSTQFDYDPRVNGVSPNLPPTYEADVHLLNTFPSAPALQRLQTLRVRYVILHVGTELNFPMYTPAAAAHTIATLPTGATAHLLGDAWLIDLPATPSRVREAPGNPP